MRKTGAEGCICAELRRGCGRIMPAAQVYRLRLELNRPRRAKCTPGLAANSGVLCLCSAVAGSFPERGHIQECSRLTLGVSGSYLSYCWLPEARHPPRTALPPAASRRAPAPGSDSAWEQSRQQATSLPGPCPPLHFPLGLRNLSNRSAGNCVGPAGFPSEKKLFF